MQDTVSVSSRSLHDDVSAGAGAQSGSSSPQASIPDIRGNASCSVQASLGSKWEHGNGTWRAALDLVGTASYMHEDYPSLPVLEYQGSAGLAFEQLPSSLHPSTSVLGAAGLCEGFGRSQLCHVRGGAAPDAQPCWIAQSMRPPSIAHVLKRMHACMQHLQAPGGAGIGVPYTMTLRSSEYTGLVESWTWEAAWVDGNAKGLISQVSPFATANCMLLPCIATGVWSLQGVVVGCCRPSFLCCLLAEEGGGLGKICLRWHRRGAHICLYAGSPLLKAK